MTIINQPYSDKGRGEHDRIFGKAKATVSVHYKTNAAGYAILYCPFREARHDPAFNVRTGSPACSLCEHCQSAHLDKSSLTGIVECSHPEGQKDKGRVRTFISRNPNA
jgi:hypothetical protein